MSVSGRVVKARSSSPVSATSKAISAPSDLPIHALETLELRRELLRHGGDLKHPLAQRHALNREVAALALPIDHLFVREHRAQVRAPVDAHLRLEGETLLEELQKDPLRPLDVVLVGGGQLALPVVREAEGLELTLEIGNVRFGRVSRVRACGHRVLLGGQAKGVPPHRVQHVVVAHPPVARHDVRCGVTFWVADMQARARRVREHVQHILLLLPGAAACGEGALILPELLPPALNLRKVVRHATFALYRQPL
eukprot:6172801-Pleurochrysis_carterae.AAC.3